MHCFSAFTFLFFLALGNGAVTGGQNENCRFVADVVFVVDESGSIGKSNFGIVLNLVTEAIKALQVDDDKEAVRVGVVTFNQVTRVHVPLMKYGDKKDLLAKVSKIGYRAGSTNVGAGLLSGWDQLRVGLANKRTGVKDSEVPRIMFIFGDGKANKGVKEISLLSALAEEMKTGKFDGNADSTTWGKPTENGPLPYPVAIFSVFIGPSGLGFDLFKSLASTPLSKWLKHFPNFKSVNVAALTKKFCEAGVGEEIKIRKGCRVKGKIVPFGQTYKMGTGGNCGTCTCKVGGARSCVGCPLMNCGAGFRLVTDPVKCCVRKCVRVRPKGCRVKGRIIPIGQTYKTGRGGSCGTCTCRVGGEITCVGCPLMGCPAGKRLVTDPVKCCVRKCVPVLPRGCRVKGRIIPVGQTYKSGRGGNCGTCTCNVGGRVSCVGCPLMRCPAGKRLVTDPVKCCVRKCVPVLPRGCKVKGKIIPVGQKYKVGRGGNCGTCTCKVGGQVSCVGCPLMRCGTGFRLVTDPVKCCVRKCVPVLPRGCRVKGKIIPVGQTYKMGKGGNCGTCTCRAGGQINCVGCPLMSCPAGQKLVTDPVKCCVRKCVSNRPCNVFGCTCQGLSNKYLTDAGVTWGSAPASARTFWRARKCKTRPSCSIFGCSCQGISNKYGTNANITWGSAPKFARDWWTARKCNTRPRNAKCRVFGCTCQGLSNRFLTDAGVTWGSAPAWAKTFWRNHKCRTRPACSIFGCSCQGISNKYGTNANITWGRAPKFARDWWGARKCNTRPLNAQCRTFGCTCQGLSNKFLADAGVTWGSTPNWAKTFWRNHKCKTAPSCRIFGCSCQGISNKYGTNANITWGSAPGFARRWWTARKCRTRPANAQCRVFGCTCQGLSNRFLTDAGVTWGSAPAWAKTFWRKHKCKTRPSCQIFGCSCQGISNKYKVVAGKSWGSSPSFARSFWKAHRCKTSPASLSYATTTTSFVVVGLGVAVFAIFIGVWKKRGHSEEYEKLLQDEAS